MKTKNFFIYAMLFAPIVAHATNPVGPSAVGQGETPVVATANAPYATANAETGDSTTVVSASYVKGAYNDAIAAVNKINANKQNVIVNTFSDEPMENIADSYGDFLYLLDRDNKNIDRYAEDSHFVTATAVALGIFSQRVNAVTTWGDNTVTKLELTTDLNDNLGNYE